MSKNLKIRQSKNVNAVPVSTGAFDAWGPSRITLRSSNAGSVTRRLKHVPISLPAVPIKGIERSDKPILKLLDDPDQAWCLEEIEQTIKV